jgi:replicative superfamily II helicase
MIFENDSVRDLADVALMERAYLLFLIDNMVPDMTMQEMKDPDVHEMQLSRLTPVQRSHFETITKAVLEGPGDGKNIFFLNAPAGSGKTFVTELMVQALR